MTNQHPAGDGGIAFELIGLDSLPRREDGEERNRPGEQRQKPGRPAQGKNVEEREPSAPGAGRSQKIEPGIRDQKRRQRERNDRENDNEAAAAMFEAKSPQRGGRAKNRREQRRNTA